MQDAREAKNVPVMRRFRNLFIILAAFGVGLIVDLFLDKIITDSSVRQLLMLAACNVMIAVSLNVINGMAGQFSIGHAGFVGLGAYTSGILASNLHAKLASGGDVSFGRSFIIVPLAMVAGGAVSGFAGFIVGLPSLRLKGDYLAIVTLGFAEIVRLTIATAKPGTGESLSTLCKSGIGNCVSGALSSLGGQNGYQGPKNEGVPLYAGPFWLIGITTVVVVLALRLKFSGWGRALRALREDEIASASVGVDPTKYKVRSFVIAAVGAGIAGALSAIMRDGTPIVQPETYNFQASFDAITMVILGGSGSVSGAVLGALFVTFTVKAIELVQGTNFVQDLRHHAEWLDLNALRMIIYAAVLILLMIMRPEGVFGERELFAKKRGDAKAKAEGKPTAA